MTRITRTLTLTMAVVLRFLREGLVVRALLWPGLFCSLALVGTAGAYAMWGTSPPVHVSHAELVTALQAADLTVIFDPDPHAAVEEGRATRSVWKEDGRWVFGRSWPGRGSLRIEAAMRDFAAARWRIDVPPVEARPTDVDRQAGLMAGLISLLFTLYGVVMGAGAVFRDRDSGCLESELALPVPFWMHGAARLLALTFILAPALGTTLLLIHSLLPIDEVGRWIFHGTVAAMTGGTCGVIAMCGMKADRGFSAPLSRALAITMGVLGAGWAWPEMGRWLPVGSLGAFLGGGDPSPVVIAGVAAVLVGGTLAFGRTEHA